MKRNSIKNRLFPVVLRKENTGYIVTNPAFEGCYSQGDTIEEALVNIKEATELCLEEAVANHKIASTGNISLHLINA